VAKRHRRCGNAIVSAVSYSKVNTIRRILLRSGDLPTFNRPAPDR
jgi:hypothetical protein